MEYNGYRIESDGKFSTLYIRAKGQGKIPKELTGMFTNHEFAKKAIDNYLSGIVTRKRKKNVKEESIFTDQPV